jgi:hypothetical protein
MGKPKHRIWYGTAMFISGLMLLLCALGIVGVWIVESVLADTTVQVITAVGNVTESLRQATQVVDQKVERMQSVSIFVSTAVTELSQKVTDQGVLKLLLPEEKEQNLADTASSIKESVGPLRSLLSAGLTTYRTIDKMPFVDLPGPSQEQIDKVEAVGGTIQSTADDLRSQIADFRSGVSNQVDKVGSAADALNSRVGEFRNLLAGLDARLAVVQESLVQLQKTILQALVLVSILITLLLAWVIYSQVELLRLYRNRWKAAGSASAQAEPAVVAAVVENETPDETPIE